MNVNEIAVRNAYRRGESRWREVVAILDNDVVYTVEGLFSLQPMKMGIMEFAAWAGERRAMYK
ncbi:hypothetical protein [Sphingomonas bisphenolicum]|uniref:SnoaL-like domain-containing protein n=1 Tax=Sphingomonas bisphenolicum TaxID=296544 RepID=A0ABM7FYI9_9SPHN|nr:hypothetical protein [Sphingomonas bisphenolicum]BBF70212.1 hypothetical protein SBA_ch1_24120 [Sphingomonas bisphenolicum]